MSTQLIPQETMQKLERIVGVMKSVCSEVEGVSDDVKNAERGDTMYRMCGQIISQLNWAFSLHDKGMDNTTD